MSEPRILVISNYGGPLNSVRPEAEIFLGLIRQGFEITLMTPKDSHYAKECAAAGAEVIDYRPTKKIDLKAVSLIKEAIERKNIDIVQAFHSKAIINSSIALLGKKTKLVGYRGYTGNIHWYDPSCYVAFLNPRVDHMICLAESVREMFLKNGMPSHKPITINKGHSAEWYDHVTAANLREFDIPSDALVCSFVANNRTKMKGLHHLINATYNLPNDLSLRILLIGKGMDTPETKSLIQKSPKPERFIFTGFRTDASELVKACDISISVSLFGEATQKAMIEAMFLGNPVLISDIPGNRGMAIDGEGGFVVEPGNEQQITEALVKFSTHKEKLPSMGQAAKKHISGFLSIERSIKEYAAFYRSIV